MQQGGKRAKGLSEHFPKVSIVCVTYNASGTLTNLLNSVEQFMPDNTELIIVDGGSTDGTLDIIKDRENTIDFWLSEPDKGIYDAMNKSIAYTKGQWVIFIGADDMLARGFNRMVSRIKDTDTIYYGNVIYYGKKFRKTYTDYFLTKLNICHQAILYPRAVFDKYNYDTQYKVYADYHLNLRCWKDPGFKFVHFKYYVASFPEGGFSTYTKDHVFETDRDQLFKLYLKPASYYRYLNRTKGVFTVLKRLILNT